MIIATQMSSLEVDRLIQAKILAEVRLILEEVSSHNGSI